MTVLFIVTGSHAYGELLIAMEFAGRVREGGWKVHFLVPYHHVPIVEQAGFPCTFLVPESRKMNTMLMRDIQGVHRPGLVVLADFINYVAAEKSYGITLDDLELFSGSVGTFDNFDWLSSDRVMDSHGRSSRRFAHVGSDRFEFWLAPCPVVSPRTPDVGSGARQYRYPLLSSLLPYEEGDRRRCRDSLGLEPDRPMVLVASALWQEVKRTSRSAQKVAAVGNALFRRLLVGVSQTAAVVLIGSKALFGHRPIPEGMVVVDRLSPPEFNRYATACDLFLSRNIVSTTLARLVLSGVASAVVQNSVAATDGQLAEEPPFELTDRSRLLIKSMEVCYRYRMFPVGWYEFLAPLMRDNPYSECLVQLEQFDEQRSLEAVMEILFDPCRRSELDRHRRKYLEELDRLSSPVDILDDLTGGMVT